MSEFTASNGITIRLDEGGYLTGKTDGTHADAGYLHATASPELGVDALAEYFRDREDKRLGRWRSVSEPHLVCYPTVGYETDEVTVVDERDGESETVLRKRSQEARGWVGEAARAYFDAHPERKPWHEAKPGEVWVLDIEENYAEPRTGPCEVRGERDDLWFLELSTESQFGLGSRLITGGRRIWPEGDAS